MTLICIAFGAELLIDYEEHVGAAFFFFYAACFVFVESR